MPPYLYPSNDSFRTSIMLGFTEKVLPNLLAGEICPGPNGEERPKEAAKHGYKRAIIPKCNMPQKPIKGMKIITAKRLEDALDYL